MKILDLAKAIAPEGDIIEIGVRPGEKLNEEMISAEDSRRTIRIEKERFLVLPVVAEWNFIVPPGEKLREQEPYDSNTNDSWMTEQKIKEYIANLQ
jgi:UDP-N-acetylglucosamine 4,6-dehydratase